MKQTLKNLKEALKRIDHELDDFSDLGNDFGAIIRKAEQKNPGAFEEFMAGVVQGAARKKDIAFHEKQVTALWEDAVKNAIRLNQPDLERFKVDIEKKIRGNANKIQGLLQGDGAAPPPKFKGKNNHSKKTEK